MGFLSSLGSSAMSMASGMSLHDLTGGWSDFSSRKNSAKYEAELSSRLMAEQYRLNLRSLRESPTAYKEGLLAAGYNPMLAITNGISTPTSSLGAAHMPSSRGESRPFAGLAKMENALANKELEKLDTEIAIAKEQSKADLLLKGAQSAKTAKEAESIDPRQVRENAKYGNGLVGESKRFVQTLMEGLGFGDGSVDDRLRDVVLPVDSSAGSAKEAKEIKVKSDEFWRKERARGERAHRRHH